ncbi:MAG: Ig-like domain-containing protein, partial [Magnetococcus sp. YQC-5]
MIGADTNNDRIIYLLDQPASNGTVQILNASSGTFSYLPKANATGSDSFTFKTFDGTDYSTPATVTVTIQPVNDKPLLTGQPATSVLLPSGYTFTPTASDGDQQPLTFSIRNLPEWATFNTTTGTLSGVPQASQAGIYEGIEISVSDGEESVSIPPFEIAVVGNNPIARASIAGGVYANTQRVVLSCLDSSGSGVELRYSLDPNADPGSFLHYTAPLEIATHTTLRFYAINGAGLSSQVVRQEYRIDTEAARVVITSPADGAALNKLPAWISGSATDIGSGVASIKIQITDGQKFLQTDGQSWGSKAAWLPVSSLNPVTGEWFYYPASGLAWTPGAWSITAMATDQAGHSTATAAIVTNALDSNHLAFTQLQMETSAPSLLPNQTITIAGKLTRFPDIGMSLAGREIILTITGPDGQSTTRITKTYDTLGHFRLEEVGGFTAKGSYRVEAAFAGSGMLAGSQTQEHVVVNRAPGYVIILAGENETGVERGLTVARIRQVLLERGFTDDTIRILSKDAAVPGYDITASKANLQGAIQSWAAGKLATSAAPLYLIATTQTDANGLLLGNGETVTPDELNSWLDTLEAGLDTEAAEEKRVIMLGGTHAGEFIAPLSDTDRVVIASASVQERAFAGLAEPGSSGVAPHGGDLFLEALLQKLGHGLSFSDGFAQSVRWTDDYLGATRGHEAPLHPLMDDNGDGVGVTHLDAVSQDGYATEHLYLGVGRSYHPAAEGNPAEWRAVTETRTVGMPGSAISLWAVANDNSRLAAENAWIEVRKPGTVTPNGDGTRIQPMDRVHFSGFDARTGRWSAQYNGFDTPGRYDFFYFVKDQQTGQVTLPAHSVAYLDRPGNQAPEAFSLAGPNNGTETGTTLVLHWSAAHDPDGDPLTYNLVIARDAGFSDVVYRREGLEDTMAVVTAEAGLADLTHYHWKVEAVDPYGAVTQSQQAWQFHTDNTNADYGILLLMAKSDLDHSMVIGAQISLALANNKVAEAIASSTGQYALVVPAGTHDLNTLNVNGAVSNLTGQVTIKTGEVNQLNIGLTPSNADLRPDIAFGNNADQFITLAEDDQPRSVGVRISDRETASDRLQVTALSSNSALLPVERILFSGSGGVRTLTIHPTGNASGRADVTIQVTDGAQQVTSTTMTVEVQPVNDLPTGTVTILGERIQGQTLTASSDLSDADGMGEIRYQWQANGEAITGATGNTLVLRETEVGKVVSVAASYSDGLGKQARVDATAAGTVENVNDLPTGVVTILGTAVQGATLTANTSALVDADGLGLIRYQWRANGADIAGATGGTLLLAESEVGKVISVVATYTDGHNVQENVVSHSTVAVVNFNDSPTGAVTISGTATQGETLTVSHTLA